MNTTKVFDEVFSQFQGPKFSVKFWNGRKINYGKGKRVTFTLVFEDEMTARRLLAQGALGFGEAYMEGKLRIEGDIEAYLRLRHQFKHVRRSFKLVNATLQSKVSVPRKRKDQIAYHYDLGNEFFKLILDHKSMSYSAGMYKTGNESLNTAQQNKLELACKWLELPKGAKVLDLGSGWGGFAKYAAQKHNWDITGYTLSRTQLEYCNKLVTKHKLERNAEFKYKDMLQDLPTEVFDSVVMIESIEHTGKDRLIGLFKQLNQTLKPGGSLYVQATGQYKQRNADRWILKYVFPGGYLPSIGELINAAGEAGFKLENFRDDTPDYIHTMTKWIENLQNSQTDIESMFDESFYRLWYLWMHGAKVAFETNYMSLFRFSFRKPK